MRSVLKTIFTSKLLLALWIISIALLLLLIFYPDKDPRKNDAGFLPCAVFATWILHQERKGEMR